MALYIECEHLTEEEKKARHELIYLFNPCLKAIFDKSPKFQAYAYNSCRQTAIFSSIFLLKVLKDYHIDTYEGNFSDVIQGNKTEYEHAFAIVYNGKRKLLVDVSRTERQLLFKTTVNIVYPKVNGYEEIKLLDYKKFDFFSMFLMEEPEYITGMRPVEVYQEAEEMYNWLKTKSKSEQINFAYKIYSKTTKIGGEFV